jgi:hypothetical protein
MVTYRDSVTGQAKNIYYPPGVCQKKLGLESQTVTVTAGHLQNRFATSLLNSQAATNRWESHYRALVVSDIKPIHLILEQVDVVQHLFQICPLWWCDLASNDKLAGIKRISET